MNETKKRNVIIGSLCAVLLLMVVGYAAFSTTLNINGTANISSTWNILITDIQTKNIVGGATNAEEPTGLNTLTATFKTNLVSPGDSIEYDITVTNSGSLNATLEKITKTDSNNPAIKFTTTGLTEGSTLAANGGTAVLTVKVEYDSTVTEQPESTTSDLTVTLDYVQEGTSGTITPPAFTGTGTVYRNTTDSLNIGDSIEGVETTTDPTTLGKNFYLKHDVVDNKIIASYVCFITDTEYCMQGGSADYYETNKVLLQGQEAWFTNNGGSCSEYSYSVVESLGYTKVYSCGRGDIPYHEVYNNGSVYASDDASGCSVAGDGLSGCYERSGSAS